MTITFSGGIAATGGMKVDIVVPPTLIQDLPITTGLVTHLDGSDSLSITESSGLVSEWINQSTTVTNDASSSGSSRPLTNSVTQNSLNGINFQDTNRRLQIDDEAGLQNIWDGGGYMIAVIKGATINGNGLLGKNTDFVGWKIFFQNLSGNTSRLVLSQQFSINRGFWRMDTSSIDNSVAQLIELEYNSDSDSNNPTMRVAGSIIANTFVSSEAEGTRDDDSTVNMQIGNLQFFTQSFGGSIFEMALYDNIPSSGDKTTLRSYLNSKWEL